MALWASNSLFGDRYEVSSLIGSGGMAKVYRAYDNKLDRPVAIKVLNLDFASDENFRERFSREARLAASLSDPNIVAIHDFGTEVIHVKDSVVPSLSKKSTLTLPYIVMELVRGKTLGRVMAVEGSQGVARAVDIVSQVLSALSAAHRIGIVHRDIKPANIMISGDSLVKVMDFGIARSLTGQDCALTGTGQVLGTVPYAAPENLRGDGVDARSDLYSVGVVLYELLTGRPPFIGKSPLAVAKQHLESIPTAPSDIVSSIPQGLSRVVMRALAKDPNDRYQSASDLRSALLELRPFNAEWDGGQSAKNSLGRVNADDVATRTSIDSVTLYDDSPTDETLVLPGPASSDGAHEIEATRVDVREIQGTRNFLRICPKVYQVRVIIVFAVLLLFLLLGMSMAFTNPSRDSMVLLGFVVTSATVVLEVYAVYALIEKQRYYTKKRRFLIGVVLILVGAIIVPIASHYDTSGHVDMNKKMVAVGGSIGTVLAVVLFNSSTRLRRALRSWAHGMGTLPEAKR